MSISSTRIRTLVIAATASAALIGVSACSSANSDDSAPASPASGEEMSPAMTADPAANLVGPGCADYAKAVPQGGGSISGMAQDPVAVAASNNPLLTTLVAAVSGQLNPDVNLVDTLNGGQFTVFAPVDDAFSKVDPATIDTLKTDDALLTKVLTYHVVPGRIAPSEIAGQHPTVEGGAVTVSGPEDALEVNDAKVICGGVSTANATVYLIDSVLMPQ